MQQLLQIARVYYKMRESLQFATIQLSMEINSHKNSRKQRPT